MSKRAVSRWHTVMDDARKKLSSGGKLEANHIKNKDITRELLGNIFVKIVNAGHELAKQLDENIDLLQLTTTKYEKESSLLNSLGSSYNELKDSMEHNFRLHYEKLETIDNFIQTQSSHSSDMINEIRSFSDVVKSKPPPTHSTQNENVVTEKISHAVKSAVIEITEKNMRESRFIIHGHGGEEPDIIAPYITEKVLGYGVPIISARLMGSDEADPVCVQLSSPEVVKEILRNSGKLKKDPIYKNAYLSPDRTNEERLKHKKLVIELKAKIRADPSKWWFIKDGRVMNNGPRRTRDSST